MITAPPGVTRSILDDDVGLSRQNFPASVSVVRSNPVMGLVGWKVNPMPEKITMVDMENTHTVTEIPCEGFSLRVVQKDHKKNVEVWRSDEPDELASFGFTTENDGDTTPHEARNYAREYANGFKHGYEVANQ